MAKSKKENKCKLCGEIFFTYPSQNREFCCKKHAQQYKGINKEWLEKRKKTCLDKYGVDVAFKSKDVQNKYKNSLKQKYGVENPFLDPNIKNKALQTIKNKYGNEIASKSDVVKKKISNKLKNRVVSRENFIKIKWDKLLNYYNITGMKPLFDKEYLENNKINHHFGNKFLFQCDKCNAITEVYLSNGYLPSCNCSDYKGYSLIEDEIRIFLSDYFDDSEMDFNRRDILSNRQEIDIFMPSLNLAIEVNGVFWHSESMGKYRDYHLYKTEKCSEKGIDLIHILDYEWMFKKPIIQSIILNKINKTPNTLYARKCNINEIKDIKILKEFLNTNHIQGYTHSSTNLGLYYDNELVSVMTFSKNRFKKDSNELEMVRFCNKLNTNIIGGASKLFKYFIKKYNISNSIISFSDRRFFTGNMYLNLGFKFDSYIKPSYIYWKDNKILNRMSCQKHKLSNLLDSFDPNLTEYENMLNNGWRRVWDSGNVKWRYN